MVCANRKLARWVDDKRDTSHVWAIGKHCRIFETHATLRRKAGERTSHRESISRRIRIVCLQTIQLLVYSRVCKWDWRAHLPRRSNRMEPKVTKSKLLGSRTCDHLIFGLPNLAWESYKKSFHTRTNSFSAPQNAFVGSVFSLYDFWAEVQASAVCKLISHAYWIFSSAPLITRVVVLTLTSKSLSGWRWQRLRTFVHTKVATEQKVLTMHTTSGAHSDWTSVLSNRSLVNSSTWR